jgi:hypothetical protein
MEPEASLLYSQYPTPDAVISTLSQMNSAHLFILFLCTILILFPIDEGRSADSPSASEPGLTETLDMFSLVLFHIHKSLYMI